MNKQQILEAIEEFIKTNGLQEITGQVMNVILTAIAKIIPDQAEITSSFGGIVNPLSDIVITPDIAKWYIGNPGTYPQADNIVLEAKKLNILSYNGTDWEKISIDLPESHVTENFEKDNAIDPQGGKQIAARYDHLLDINKGFLERVIPTPPIIKTILQTEAVFGGQFLENNNTVSENLGYPDIGVIHNLNVLEAGELRVNNMYNLSITGKPAILGIKKDDTIITLLDYTSPDFEGNKIFDLSDIKEISIQVDSSHFPTIDLHLYTYESIDSKDYFDEKLKTLAYFLNTEDVEWTEITMPQSGEVDNEAMGLGFSPIPGVGFAYGLIQNTSLNGYDFIKVEGSLSQFSGLWLWGQNNATGIYDEILTGVKYGSYIFNIDHTKYEAYGYTRFKAGTKFHKGKKVTKPIEEDAVKTYIDNHVSNGSSISNEIKATIKSPTKLVKVNFETNDALPVDKTVKANGVYNYDDGEGTVFKKFGTLEVQGSSSAQYPKKNWTFAFFNNEAKTSEFKLRIGKWVQHSEFVFKSNYIDATQSRNLVSNKIWEDIVQSRKTYPKRENEKTYVSSNGSVADRFDSGALCHVDGFPCELYVNNVFYGLGTFNLGKKRENYDLASSNQNHIQIAAETHINFDSYTAAEWEIRNPKTPDSNFTTKINAWFAANALTGQSFKDAFPTNHDVRNAIEFFLLAEFIMAQDMFAKNFILTSWDGVKFAFMPYDMDTVFGLSWEGLNILAPTDTIRNIPFWAKFYTTYTPEIKARYAELKAADILSVSNVYKHFSSMAKIFGVEKYKQDFERWTQIPSNNLGVTNPYGSGGCYTSVSQIMDWTKNRLTWMDSQYS